MKIKHNKKRNTAFVFEALIREATVAIIKESHGTKEKVVSIIKKHFVPGSVLYKDLQNYRSLYENQSLRRDIAEKIVKEAKLASRSLDAEGLFLSQSELIADVNKELTPAVFNNFVPNYKTLASIAQMFSDKPSPKSTVILENNIIENMTLSETKQETMEPIDNLIMTSFVKKFNEKYKDELLENQKTLLGHYITSFVDNGIQLKTFLNTEIASLKEALVSSLEDKLTTDDKELASKTKQVIEKLDTYHTRGVEEGVIFSILKTQALVKEINNNGN
tara:strand:- start:556 stop:1383 length:828 start_codon:yes stop_codon:yes gene_type:complete